MAEGLSNSKFCPLIQDDRDGCYFCKMDSLATEDAIYFCASHYEQCEIYRNYFEDRKDNHRESH